MIGAIDIETFKWNPQNEVYEPILNSQEFSLGAILLENNKIEFFTNSDDMYNYIIDLGTKLKSKKSKLTVYGHNTGYDWYGIAKNHLFDNKIKYYTQSPFLACLNEHNMISDTMTFFKMSLKELGEIIGLPKLEMPQSFKSIDEIKQYLTRDVEITLKAIQHLKHTLEQLGYKPKKLLTAGQVAMTCFLTHCKKVGTFYTFMHIGEDNRPSIYKSNYDDKLRLAYRGGDNSAYETGTFSNVSLIDINALYAYIMCNMQFPALNTEKFIKGSEIKCNDEWINKLGIIKCEATCPKINTYPCLPIRYNKLIMFPQTGTLKATWTIPEIKYAIEKGYSINKIEYIITYEIGINPFKSFLEPLHELEKTTEDKLTKVTCKLLRNNLSGKFAQKRENSEKLLIKRDELPFYLALGYSPVAEMQTQYLIERSTGKYEAYYTNPLISALITAGARLYLNKFKHYFNKENLLYCDTDSIMFTGQIPKEIVLSKNMGDWKLVNKESNATILGEKRYTIGETKKFSGIHLKNVTPETFTLKQPIKQLNQIGIGRALKINRLDLIGTFEEVTKEVSEDKKIDIELPIYIEEVE